MDFSNGLEQLKEGINQRLSQEADLLNKAFLQVKKDVENYVSNYAGAYKSLDSFSDQKDIAQRGNEPDGFSYGYEVIPCMNPQDKIYFPLVYSFHDVGATAIEENSGCAHLLFNFALRSIISYPIGDCNVYMIDSNVSGHFNMLSQISTRLDDTKADKPYFHYITGEDEKNRLILDLANILDNNIRNYVSKYSDLRSYNKNNLSMTVPYHFVFIKDISEAYPEKNQIDRLARMISSNNAVKAGIHIFYTYDKNQLKDNSNSYYADTFRAVKNLVNMSHIIESPKQHYTGSEMRLEPLATSDVANRIIRYVETQKPPVTVMSFKDEIQQKLATGSLWNPSFKRAEAHLPIAIGFQNAITPKEVDICFNGDSPHMFVGGKTGSGKTILLHNLIINGAMRYSPEQLQFYLVDMKGGLSFSPYKLLPHVVALSVSSSRHYALSLMELFLEENARRQSIFKRTGASNLDSYNEIAPSKNMPKLPYLFGIIDEFQKLFVGTDEKKKAEDAIKYVHTEARASGIFLALCTQEPPGNISRSQIGPKIALTCDPNESLTLLGNVGASRLNGKGRAIINSHPTGEEQYNQEFQVAFIHEQKELPVYVQQIRDIYLKQNGGVDKLSHLCYDDNDHAARLSADIICHIMQQRESAQPYIYIGIPGFFRKEHVKFFFHRDSQSNIAMVGNDRPAALRLTGIIVIQFMSAYKKTGGKVYISDLQRTTESTYGKLQFLGSKQGVSHSGSLELKDTMKKVYQMLCDRKSNPTKSVHEPEVLYALLDLKPDNNFSNSRPVAYNLGGGTVDKSSLDMLRELIDEGPDYGIHVLVYSYNYANIESLLSVYNNSLLPKMEIKIALRGGNSVRVLNKIISAEVVNDYGKGIIRMPEEMGMRYKGSDDFGDPFLIYDTIDDKQLQGTVWDTLFKNLPNKED